MMQPADEFDFSGVAVLTDDNGEFTASADARKHLCHLSDGRVLVAEGQSLNPHVQSYIFRLNRLGWKYKLIQVSNEVIERLYSRGGGEKVDHTQMQRNAKQLLMRACREHASDIHIRVRKFNTDIYFRIHNDLTRVVGYSREYGERLLSTLYGAMTDVSDTSYKPNERQDARIGDRDKLPEELHGVRIATAPTVDGAVMVLRLLYNDAGESYDPQILGFSEAQTRMLQSVKELPSGMNIIGGPTGSGKSTTLQRLLAGQVKEREGRQCIVTVEDPPEYPIEGTVQTPVRGATGETERSSVFSEAIANAMRLDPDVIMIGEIRDHASAQLSLRAAMTGHQLWTTVHANSARAIIDRLVDLGLPMNMIADSSLINCLICQRLVKLLCPHCKKNLASHAEALTPAAYRRVLDATGKSPDEIFLAGTGCEHCRGNCTIGRTVVAEVILPDRRFFELIRAGEKDAANQYWIETGGVPMRRHAAQKVAAGLVDPRMAEYVVGPLVRNSEPWTGQTQGGDDAI
ncbi:MAG: type secretion system protein [Noviherbaspirillum sp.]|nr:type secretion system protein [Noviherbaspirillum sp.]